MNIFSATNHLIFKELYQKTNSTLSYKPKTKNSSNVNHRTPRDQWLSSISACIPYGYTLCLVKIFDPFLCRSTFYNCSHFD
jgi:hypothetical protein